MADEQQMLEQTTVLRQMFPAFTTDGGQLSSFWPREPGGGYPLCSLHARTLFKKNAQKGFVFLFLFIFIFFMFSENTKNIFFDYQLWRAPQDLF